MVSEPRWRTLLCYGTVFIFLTLPLIVFALALTSAEFEQHIKEYKFLSSFYQSVTALAFGLSGLKSLDRYIETKNGNHKS